MSFWLMAIQTYEYIINEEQHAVDLNSDHVISNFMMYTLDQLTKPKVLIHNQQTQKEIINSTLGSSIFNINNGEFLMKNGRGLKQCRFKGKKNRHTLAVTDNSVKTVQRALTVDEQTVAN